MGLFLEESSVPKRRVALQNLFRPLAPRSRVDTFMRTGRDAVQLGLGYDNFGSSLRSARHKSRVDGVYINYFEVWLPAQQLGRMFLDKAYFHLDRALGPGLEDEELLALHCDPAIGSSDGAFEYKSGPHVHLASAGRPFNRAHIALCLQNREAVCNDLKTFGEALKLIYAMVNDEFLSVLETEFS